MKLKKCVSCDKEISKNASVCPHCGHKYNKKSGCFTRALVLFIIIIVVIGYISTKSDKPISSVEELSQRERTTIGKVNSIFRADTKFKNADGSYIILNVSKIEKHQEYKSERSQILENAIVIKNVTGIDVTRKFVKNVGYFILFDDIGNEIDILNDIWTQKGKEFSEIIITLKNKKDFESCKYIIIGGLDRSSNNGKDKMIFTINQN